MFLGPNPTVALLQVCRPSARNAFLIAVTPVCPWTSPIALTPHCFIDVSKKAPHIKCLLALSNIMPVNQPACVHSPLRQTFPLQSPCSFPCPLYLLTPAPPYLALLCSAPELPVPFHLLSDCLLLAPRCTFSIISDPSAALWHVSSPSLQLQEAV